MTIYDSALELLRQIYGFVFLIVIIFVILFWRKIIDFFFHKKKKKEDVVMISNELFPPQQDALFGEEGIRMGIADLAEQKTEIEKVITGIKEEGQKILEGEKKLDEEYRQKRLNFSNQKKTLGMKYGTWINQLRLIDNMIENQKRMEESFKKLKEIHFLKRKR